MGNIYDVIKEQPIDNNLRRTHHGGKKLTFADPHPEEEPVKRKTPSLPVHPNILIGMICVVLFGGIFYYFYEFSSIISFQPLLKDYPPTPTSAPFIPFQQLAFDPENIEIETASTVPHYTLTLTDRKGLIALLTNLGIFDNLQKNAPTSIFEKITVQLTGSVPTVPSHQTQGSSEVVSHIQSVPTGIEFYLYVSKSVLEKNATPALSVDIVFIEALYNFSTNEDTAHFEQGWNSLQTLQYGSKRFGGNYLVVKPEEKSQN